MARKFPTLPFTPFDNDEAIRNFTTRSSSIRGDWLMYLEDGEFTDRKKYAVGDVVPLPVRNNAANKIDFDSISWWDSIWGFVDPSTGKKVGRMKMAMEDHRGFLGSNVYMGYNPWGWGGQTQLRGVAFGPDSLISPEEMERVASAALPGIDVVDPDGDTVVRLEKYLPYNQAVNNFNSVVPLIEDEDSTIPEYIDSLVDSGIGAMEDGEYEYEINRFTQKEQDVLVGKLKESLTESQLKYLGLDKVNLIDGITPVEMPMMYKNIINGLPEVDFALLKNEVNGNTRFRLPLSAFQEAFDSWITNDARSSWFDGEYLDNMEGDKAFLMKLMEDPTAIHENGESFVEVVGSGRYYWNLGGYDRASFLNMVFATPTGYEKYREYESLRAALMKQGQTPVNWDFNTNSNLDNLQPTFRNDRFGITSRSKIYDKRVNGPSTNIRFRNYDQGRGVRRYVANPSRKLADRKTAWMQADYLRSNGLYVRSVKMGDGSYLNYMSLKARGRM